MKIQMMLVAAALCASGAQAVNVTMGDSSSGWNGFMNVFETPEHGGSYVFGSGWGIGDLNASFNDGAGTVTMTPNTIGDPNPFWYSPSGGPGAIGNKVMDANLYHQVDGSYSGQTVTFQGVVLSNSLTSGHVATLFIKDFAPDYSSFNQAVIPVTPGAFSFSLATVNDPGRHVQWGVEMIGRCVWYTDIAQFGSAVFSQAVPQPGALAALGMGGLLAARRRRR